MASKKDEDLFYVRLGYNIRLFRTKAKKSQEALADYLGLSRVSVVNIEKGKQKIQIHDLVLAAKFLNTSLADLAPQQVESDDAILNKNLKEKINRQFYPNESGILKIEDFVKISLSNFNKENDK